MSQINQQHGTNNKNWRRNSIYSIVKVIYAGDEVSRKEGKKELSVICVEVMV